MANTISPPGEQILLNTAFDRNDVTKIHGKTCYISFPCPTRLFLKIVAINELRYALELVQHRKDNTIIGRVTKIIYGIHSFKPEKWIESYELPSLPETILTAKIFKLAILLFAILTLPLKELISSKYSRLILRGALLVALRTASQLRRRKTFLIWPMGVVGIALHDGSQQDQAFISEFLVGMDKFAWTKGLSVRTSRILRKFWESQKTDWDSCWNEGCVMY